MNNIDIIGYIATILIIFNQIPQAYKVFKTNDLCGLSPWTYLLLFMANVLWLIYAIGKNDIPLIITNGVGLIPVTYINWLFIKRLN